MFINFLSTVMRFLPIVLLTFSSLLITACGSGEAEQQTSQTNESTPQKVVDESSLIGKWVIDTAHHTPDQARQDLQLVAIEFSDQQNVLLSTYVRRRNFGDPIIEDHHETNRIRWAMTFTQTEDLMMTYNKFDSGKIVFNQTDNQNWGQGYRKIQYEYDFKGPNLILTHKEGGPQRAQTPQYYKRLGNAKSFQEEQESIITAFKNKLKQIDQEITRKFEEVWSVLGDDIYPNKKQLEFAIKCINEDQHKDNSFDLAVILDPLSKGDWHQWRKDYITNALLIIPSKNIKTKTHAYIRKNEAWLRIWFSGENDTYRRKKGIVLHLEMHDGKITCVLPAKTNDVLRDYFKDEGMKMFNDDMPGINPEIASKLLEPYKQ